MSDTKTVEEKRQRLIKVLSNNVNSGNVVEIIKAVEDFIDDKIKMAVENHEDAHHAEFDGGGF